MKNAKTLNFSSALMGEIYAWSRRASQKAVSYYYKVLDERLDIVIVGGGISGCMAAWELGKDPRNKITMLEQGDELMPPFSASAIQPGRAGFGFHYFHQPTALTYLGATCKFLMAFIDECPEIIQDYDQERTHPRRRGCYGVLKGSGHRAEILATYDALKDEYRLLCMMYPQLQRWFGPVDDFYRILTLEEANQRFKGLAYFDTSYEFVIETAEALLDTGVFANLLREKIASMPNINVLTKRELISISNDDPRREQLQKRWPSRYTCHVINKRGKIQHFSAPVVIVATWANADYFLATAGALIENQDITNRLKAKIIVKLPPALENIGSLFIGMRHGCMMTNKGNGVAHMTASEITNILRHSVGEGTRPSTEYMSYINGSIDKAEKSKIAQDILAQVKSIFRQDLITAANRLREQANSSTKDDIVRVEKEIKDLEESLHHLDEIQLLDIGFGTVQIDGKPNFDDPDSELHKRTNIGVHAYDEQKLDGLYKVVSRKFFYGLEAAQQLKAHVDIYRQKATHRASKDVQSDIVTQRPYTRRFSYTKFTTHWSHKKFDDSIQETTPLLFKKEGVATSGNSPAKVSYPRKTACFQESFFYHRPYSPISGPKTWLNQQTLRFKK